MVAGKISVVINTYNEAEKLKTALSSLKWADEIVVCDMHSEDESAKVAKEYGAKVFLHRKEDFVERARNYAISKASYDWVLILDPDEEIPSTLVKRLKEISSKTQQIDYVKIPRKNVIFGHTMKASMWWPDLNIRFFKKGKVIWQDKIHQPPKSLGQGIELPAKGEYAILHHHYASLNEYLEKVIRYSKAQAEEIKNEGYIFNWRDLIRKPLSEFLSRFFAGRGYEDGVHGLALSFLQATSFLIVYLKIWEMENFKAGEVSLKDFKEAGDKAGFEIDYWTKNTGQPRNMFGKIFRKFKNTI